MVGRSWLSVSAWSTVVLSLGSAAIGAIAALTGTAQLRSGRLERERSELAAWRDRAGGVVGPILGVLDDMEPRAIAEHQGRSQRTIEKVVAGGWPVMPCSRSGPPTHHGRLLR